MRAQQSTASGMSQPGAEQMGLDEIVVTAQRRAENLQDVPIAVTAVSNERLTAAGVTTVQSLSIAVPGLQMLSIGNQLTPRLRGVGSGTTGPGLEGAVAVYIDDVYYAFGGDIAADLSDVQQISVLKGPQGTLFGRNATGGVVQIMTREPSRDLKIDLGTSIDNYATWRSDAYVSGGLTDTITAGLSLAYTTQGEGWGENHFTGNDTFKIDRSFTGRAKIKWEVGPDTTVSLHGDYSDREGNPAVNFRAFPEFDGVIPTPKPRRKWDTNSYNDAFVDYTGGGGALHLSHDLGFASLVSISAYRESKFRFVFSPSLSTVPALDLDLTYKSRQFTQEVRLVTSGSGPLTYTLGAYYFFNDAGVDPHLVNVRGLLAAPLAHIQPRKVGDQVAKSLAGFAQATYEVTPTTRLTGGFRLMHEKKELDVSTFVAFPPGPAVPTGSFTPKISGTDPTWRVSIDQDLGRDVLLYAAYNRGLKSGGFNVQEPANPAFLPEKLDAYEAGVKGEFFDRRVRLNLAGFYYKYSNMQVPIYRETIVIVNGAGAKIYGVDAELEGRPMDQLRVYASANWLHAKFTKFDEAPSVILVGNRPGPSITVDAAGNVLPYSSKFTYTLGADYKFESTIGDLLFNVNDSYNSGYHLEADNRLRQGSHHILNGSLTWSFANSRYSVRAFVNNILNEAVVSQAGSLPDLAFIADYSNSPRTYGVALRIEL